MPGDFCEITEQLPNIDGSTLTSPIVFLIVSNVTAPGLSRIGICSVRSITVDSIPIWVLPPSKMMLTLPSRSLITWSADVGLGLPEIFADGAAIGQPDSLIKASEILFL